MRAISGSFRWIGRTSVARCAVKIWRKIVLGILFLLGFAGLSLWLWVTDQVCREPAQLDAVTQHIIPNNCHGKIVYITPFESDVLQWLIPLYLPILVLTSFLKKRWAN
jgi:hypothetical protein